MNLPNVLTLSRIFVVPLLVVVLLTPFSEDWFGLQRHLLGVALFLAYAAGMGLVITALTVAIALFTSSVPAKAANAGSCLTNAAAMG